MPQLHWQQHDDTTEITHTDLGSYMVECESDTYYRIWLPDENGRCTIRRGGYPNSEIAKAAVLRLFNLRITNGTVRPSDEQFGQVDAQVVPSAPTMDFSTLENRIVDNVASALVDQAFTSLFGSNLSEVVMPTGQCLYTELEVEAAQCLMEAVIDIRAEVYEAQKEETESSVIDWRQQLDDWFSNVGSFEMRRLCRSWARTVESVWREMPDEWKDCVVYDFEYMPTILELVDWGPTLNEPQLPNREDIKAALAEFKGTLR